jgi:KDO2-lipid IV(A) lauroyltransferase
MSLVLRLLAISPLWLLHALGAVMGWLTYAASAPYRRRLQAHAALAGVSPAQARAAVGQAGKMVAELPKLWLRPADVPLGALADWPDRAPVEQALAAGRGLVLLTPHLGAFEICAQAYAEHFGHRAPITVLYRPARQVALRRWVEQSRRRPGLQTAPASLQGVRQLIRALRQGDTVGLLPDQVPPQGQGVWAPFFGRPAYTMTLAARLLQQTGAALVLLWCERLPRGRGYRVHTRAVEPAVMAELAQADPAQSAALINRLMEQLILEGPQQYLWGYNRYKQPRTLAEAPAIPPSAPNSASASASASPAAGDEAGRG